MIGVKGFRAADKQAADPSDPLDLRPRDGKDMKVVSGVVMGLAALAVYLKSFLGSAEAEDNGAPEDDPQAHTEDENSDDAPIGNALSLTLARATEGEADRPADTKATDAQAEPPVLGPLGNILLGRGALGSGGYDLQVTVANTTLPPFKVSFARPDAMPGPKAVVAGAPGGDFGLAGDDGLLPLPRWQDANDTDDGAPPPEVDARNRAPRTNGPVALGEIGSGTALTFALGHLLLGSFDPEGDALRITELEAERGSFLPTQHGWRYLADAEHLGEVEISYLIGDGTTAIRQTAVVTVVENVFIGTPDVDLLIGTDGRDVILGLASDDDLVGNGGRDLIDGGDGNDMIAGGDGDDSLLGGAGDDVIYGGEGDDRIAGGDGNDQLYGGAGDDVIEGNAGDDLIDGGLGDDILFGGDGHDVIDGGEGRDVIDGGAGDDRIDGGTGDDVLLDGAGADTVTGGAGDDRVVVTDDADNDVFSGGEGQDTLDHSSANAPVTIDLSRGESSTSVGGSDSFEGFEHFVGSAEDDLFIGGGTGAGLTGGGGSDEFRFEQGDFVDHPAALFTISDFGLDDFISIYSGRGGHSIRKQQKSLEDRIEDFFEDATDDLDMDEPKLRFSHEWSEDMRLTVIEVDFDRDREFDLRIELQGTFQLVTEDC